MSRSVILCAESVVTGAPSPGPVRCLRIEGGRITHLGAGAADLPPSDVVLHRPSAVVVPGLVDAHLHLAPLGATGRQLDLRSCTSADAVAERVAVAARVGEGWVVGTGWDQNRWDTPAGLDRERLDRAAGSRPVWLTRVDVHAAWLNSAALAACGIHAGTPDPPGGEIARDASGRPTGLLVDAAMELAASGRPPPAPETLRSDLLAAQARCRAAGLVAVQDHYVTPEVLEALVALEAEGALPLSVQAYLVGSPERLAPLLARPHRGPKVQVLGVKLFADGALGSHGAALFEPYADRPDHSGLLLSRPGELAARAVGFAQAGARVSIHAIGDRAVAEALDALAAVRREADPAGVHRVEHAQIVRPRDVPRFAELGLVASVQPVHAVEDLAWVGGRLGAARLGDTYPWRRLAEAGATLAFGSDAPVSPPDPMAALHAAVDRGRSGPLPQGWHTDEALTPEAALLALTSGAWAAVEHPEAGTLTPGAPAHLTLLDGHPTRVTPGDPWRPKVLETWIDGEPA